MSEPQPPEREELKTPLSFKLMMAAIVIYLGWRLVQGVLWLIDRIG
ncbi:MAG TPA: hypothetical protein VI980_09490 [Acidimicrobiia bacterium]|nr:hypothetical protein [Acidimicrobiia bacterium]